MTRASPIALAALLAALLAACTAGEPPATNSSAEGSTIPRVFPLPQSPEHGPWRSILPDRRPIFKTPSSDRPEWLPNLPENLPRIPAPNDGFRDTLATFGAGPVNQTSANSDLGGGWPVPSQPNIS